MNDVIYYVVIPVGVVILIILLIGLCWYCRRQRKQSDIDKALRSSQSYAQTDTVVRHTISLGKENVNNNLPTPDNNTVIMPNHSTEIEYKLSSDKNAKKPINPNKNTLPKTITTTLQNQPSSTSKKLKFGNNASVVDSDEEDPSINEDEIDEIMNDDIDDKEIAQMTKTGLGLHTKLSAIDITKGINDVDDNTDDDESDDDIVNEDYDIDGNTNKNNINIDDNNNINHSNNGSNNGSKRSSYVDILNNHQNTRNNAHSIVLSSDDDNDINDNDNKGMLGDDIDNNKDKHVRMISSEEIDYFAKLKNEIDDDDGARSRGISSANHSMHAKLIS